MKQWMLFFSILVLLSVSLAAVNVIPISNRNEVRLVNSTSTGLTLHYDIDKVECSDVSVKGGNFSNLQINGYTNTSNIGEPALPLNRKLIAVPLGAQVNVRVLSSNMQEYDLRTAGIRYPVYPAQPSVSKSADPANLPFEYKSSAYMLNKYSDNPIAHVEEIGIMRGIRLFAVDFEPVLYNPTTQKVKVYNDVEIRFDFVGGNTSSTDDLRMRTYSPAFENLYQKTIINYEEPNIRTSLLRYPLGYLIITDPAFSSTMASFVTWKKQQGYNVTMVTTATTGTTTTSIKAYIQNIWDTATVNNPAPSYLLFVGDVAQIPAYTGATSSGHVTDLDYVKLNGTDYVPEMYYGRFSVTTSTECQNIIDKTLMFEKTTMPSTAYLGNVDMIAGQDATYGPTHGDGQINYGTTNYFNAAHGITSSTYLYAISGSSDAQILADVTAGRGYVNYTAHGSETGWYDPSFSNSDVANLNNTNKYPVMVGNCCLTNHFDTAVCFGEALTRAANEGAVAYIGGTNSTYWDEDYWWGVGAKLTGTQISSNGGTPPAWVANKIGVYDGIFHEHSEAVADWTTTMGSMIFMGNLAVTQGASSRINYYWEIYSIMGDPSLAPYMGVPVANAVTAPAQILVGQTTYTIQAAANSYVCLSMGGTIYGVGTVDGTGSLTLTITPFSTVGTADLVVTCQNKVTNIRTVSVVPASGPYVTVDSYAYNDANNSIPEYNETGRFNMTFKNVGTVTATGIATTLSTSTSGITITDNSEAIASLAAGASTTITNAYTYTSANNMVDQTIVPFHVAIVGSDTWTYDFNTTINAPAIAFGTFTISDPTGNNNGQLDPGETVTITIPLNNTGHASTVAGTATLASPTTGITVTNGTYNASAIAAGGSASATFTLSVGSGVAIGSVVTLNFNATAGMYTATKATVATVGIAQETFETGNLSAYAWTLAGSTPYWSVVNTGAYAGTYCAKSGAITHSQNTDLKVTMNITNAGSITFYKMVSSESGYDFLKFYIDTTETGSWSGVETAYAQVTYPVTSGTHTFKWTYLKDSSLSSGSDCAWIDDIVFPPTSGSVVSFDPPQTLTSVAKNGSVTLNWLAPASGTPASYKVYRGGVSVASSITGLTYTNTGLTNGTSYAFYVTAVYTTPSAGESPASNTVNATPIAAPPTALTATGGNTIVNLSWTAPTNETPNGYKVYRNSTLITPTAITATTYSDTGLTNGTSYSYYVTSVFNTPAAESAASNTATATPSTATTVTIGTGTTTVRQPISSYYGYERSANLFTTAEIGITGLIQTLSWYPTVTAATAFPTKIYIKTTTSTALTASTWATMISGATLVFDGTVTGTTASTWKTVDITDFTYASNNLIVMVECNYGGSGTGASAGSAFRYTASAANMVETWAADTSAPTGNGTLGTARPNIQMTIGALASNPVFYVNPSSVPFNNVILNNTSAPQTLTVTNTGGGTLQINSTVPTGTDAAMFDLTDLNTYPKYLTTGQSMTVTVTFTPTSLGAKTAAIRFTDTLTKSAHDVTLTGTGYNPTITTFPYSESFDGTTFAPQDWTNQLIAGTASPGTWDRQTAGTSPTCAPYTGAGMARYNSYTIQAGNHAILSTPPMNIPGANYRVSFWFYRDASSSYNTTLYSDEGVTVFYGTSPTDTTQCVSLGYVPRDIVFAPVVATAGWYQYTYSFGAGSNGNGKYVIFKAKSKYGDNMFLDDVMVDAASSLPVFSMTPSSLDFGTVTTGLTTTRTFTISNTGGQSLTGNITTPTGYSVVQSAKATKTSNERNTIGYSVGVGGTSTFTVTFAPVVGQPYTGSIGITSNDANHLTNSLTVTGVGVTPPEISVDPSELTKDLMPDETGSDIVTVSNAGGMSLNYSVVLQASKSIGGSTFSCSPMSFAPGTTTTLTIAVTNGSTDTEWIKDLNVTFPAGVTVISSTNLVGGSGGDMVSNGTIGDGVTVNWHGETTGGWGYIHDTETATCTIDISTLSSFSTDMMMNYQISGDIYGAEPHVINSSLAITNIGAAVPWLNVAPTVGSVVGGGSTNLTVNYNSSGMSAGTYNAMIQINSNDPNSPTKEVLVIMNVGFVNHAPTINLPAAWNFNKGATLMQDFTPFIYDADSDPITITYSGNTHIQVAVNVHSITFTADPNWVGTENITFAVDDGQGGTNSDQIAVTVNPVNVPTWTPVVYPNNSATVYSTVTIDGVPAEAGDIVGAFVNGECRGTGTVVVARAAFVTMLINVASNGETVNFKLYDANGDILYDAANTIVVNIGETQGGPGNYVPVEVVTTVQSPVNVQLQPQSSNFAISWTAVPNANTYYVYRAAAPNGSYTKIATVHTNSYLDTDTAGIMYFYYITAENIITK